MRPDGPDGGDPDGDDPNGGDTGPDDEPDDGDDDGGNGATSPVNLSGMTKSELLDYAESQGITGLDGLTKAQIIETLKGGA